MLRRVSILAIVGALAKIPVWAITVIPQPNSVYTSSTTLIDFSALSDGTSTSFISGGGLTVLFSSSVMRLTVGQAWATWNQPPATESDSPPVLFSSGSPDLFMTLVGPPVRVFGFEAQPDLSDVEPMTATFFSAGGPLSPPIALNVSGNGGALLFAASSDVPITGWSYSMPQGTISRSLTSGSPQSRSRQRCCCSVLAWLHWTSRDGGRGAR